MSITTSRVSVGTSATLLYAHPQSAADAGDYNSKNVALLNVSAAPTTVVLGPSGVTAANGARWIVEAGRTLSVAIEPGEALYGIVASGTQDVDVLVNGR